MKARKVGLAFHSWLNKRSTSMTRPSKWRPCLPLFPNSMKLQQHATATQSPVSIEKPQPKETSCATQSTPPPNTETEKKETELRHTPYKSSPKSSLHPSNQVRSTTNHQHKSSFEPKRNSPPAIVRNTTTPSRRWKLQTCVAASESRPKEKVVKRESRSKRGKSS